MNLIIARSALQTMQNEVMSSRADLETGGILLGRRGRADLEVTRAGTPGPAAVRTASYFLRDLVHSQSIAQEQELEDGSVWLGEWHTHPTGPSSPSAADVRTFEKLAADPELHFADGVLSIVVVPVDDQFLLRGWLYKDRVLQVLDLHLD